MSRPQSALARLRTHPLAVDCALAGLLVLAGLVGLFEPYDFGRLGGELPSPDPLGVILVIAAAAPVAVRRQWPECALLTALAATLMFYLRGYYFRLAGTASTA